MAQSPMRTARGGVGGSPSFRSSARPSMTMAGSLEELTPKYGMDGDVDVVVDYEGQLHSRQTNRTESVQDPLALQMIHLQRAENNRSV